MAGVNIHAPAGSSVATITVNGVPVVPEIATTTAEEYTPMEVSTIGMYIDTSNKRFTTPVTGLRSLDNLTNADLIIGTEAARNTMLSVVSINGSKRVTIVEANEEYHGVETGRRTRDGLPIVRYSPHMRVDNFGSRPVSIAADVVQAHALKMIEIGRASCRERV